MTEETPRANEPRSRLRDSTILKSIGNTLKRPKSQLQPTTQSCKEPVDRDVNQLSGGGCHDQLVQSMLLMAA